MYRPLQSAFIYPLEFQVSDRYHVFIQMIVPRASSAMRIEAALILMFLKILIKNQQELKKITMHTRGMMVDLMTSRICLCRAVSKP